MSSRHVALVTGGSRGIGRAIALACGRAGAAVLVAARGAEACAAVAREIEQAGGTAWPLELDLTDARSLDDALVRAQELAREPIDWLVNNAGLALSAPFLQHGREQGQDLYERHLAVNFHGPRRLIEGLAPAMIRAGRGRIVNVASSAGLIGYAYVAAYCASKHALVGYSSSAAKELGKNGVTLNLVCPHYVDSPMTDASVARIVEKTGRTPEAARALLAAQNPGGTLIQPAEVAEVVLELLEGERNGAVAELVGGGGVAGKGTVRWR